MTVTHKKDKTFEYIYLKNVVAYYATVYKPRDKMEKPGKDAGNKSEQEYSIQVFMTQEDREFLESAEVNVNKQVFEVGVDKNKKRKIKYPLLKDDGTDAYAAVEGLHGTQLTLNSHSKAGKPNVLTVVDKQGVPFTDDIGNGSRVTIKCYGYRNKDNQLNIALDLIMVVEHVVYEGSNGDGTFEDDELGISYTKKSPSERKANDIASEMADNDLNDDIAY
jgi:hypothetical protein